MLSQTSEYALRAMVWIANRHETFHNAPEIARSTQVPLDYLSKILQTLARISLLEKKRGVKGGYRLARAPKEISILSIVEPFDSISRIKSCPLKLKEHADGLCPLHKKLDEFACSLRSSLSSTTLADLMRNPHLPLCPHDS